ncbi:MAG: nucleoside deaminase [Bacteroidota bacterium]
MTKRTFYRVMLLFIFLIILFYFFQSGLYHLHSNKSISEAEKLILLNEAGHSLPSLDVPVGSILIYNDTILATGHNTVRMDSNVAGHAEINAINNAIRKTGFEKFSLLNRDKLILVSTFEPCMMCRGVILEYNIRHVYFLKGKGIFNWLKNDFRQFRYEWNKRKSAGDELQDSLFLLHPKYKEQNSN